MTVGEKVKKARKAKGLTQKELGEKLGVTQALIGHYESGKRNPKDETRQKIAAALNVNVSSLYDYDLFNAMTTAEPWIDIEDIHHEHFIKHRINMMKRRKEKYQNEKNYDEYFDLVLLDFFYELNEDGKIEACNRVEELTELKKYKKKPPETTDGDK